MSGEKGSGRRPLNLRREALKVAPIRRKNAMGMTILRSMVARKYPLELLSRYLASGRSVENWE